MGQPIQERAMEAEDQPKAFEELGKQIQQYMKIIEAYKAKVIFFLWGEYIFCGETWSRTCFHLYVISFLKKDELYDHLEELEVMKVEKQVNDTMAWMNNKMNQQSKQSLTVEPVVKACEILAKTKVRLVKSC